MNGFPAVSAVLLGASTVYHNYDGRLPQEIRTTMIIRTLLHVVP
jgi:hypothetical protein